MFGEKDLSSDLPCEGDEKGQNPVEKIGFSQKGMGFFRGSNSKMDLVGFSSSRSSTKPGNSGFQELTLSYLCDNPKLGLPQNGNISQKGKEVVLVSENPNQDEKWVERDFLNLSGSRGNSSKREVDEEFEERDNSSREKKPKLETLNLSLALPDVSLSLTASNALQNGDPQIRSKPCRSVHSLPQSMNTQTTCSNDFTAASLSYSYSHPFSHNPSCSLTRNSTENYEYSVGRDDQLWCGGEGTNGSVHSRFRPIGDAVVLANPAGGGGGGGGISLHKTTSSDNHSFFPSELPARPRIDDHSGDSRRRNSDNLRVLESMDAGRGRKLSSPERILREIVLEAIPAMAQIIQELSDDTLKATKEYLTKIIAAPEKREELVMLQNWLERRSDLTKETLSKCQKEQLEIMVAIKMGLKSFLSEEDRLPTTELLEIFLFMRCRNLNCKSLLPVDDCDCKICSGNKGFCSSCMCPVCLSFDSASNTCSWVGCDACSHWCHAACGLQRNLIKPGPSLKGPSGITEMQFHCIGCGHASEMFGFVKDVFVCCAKDWGLETLIKELDCVRKIFRGSDDSKGKELHVKADELLTKLESKVMPASDACNIIIQFFNYTDGMTDLSVSGVSTKNMMITQASLAKDEASITPATSLLPKYNAHNANAFSQKDLKAALMSELKFEDEFQFGRLSQNDGFDSLESMIRIKEAEARMFQDKADEARRDAEGYKRMIQVRTEKLEEEYAEKLARLCLQETEDRRRKKHEELKVLENSNGDYYKMKLRMQAEIDGLLERMEATKQQLV
ncbi:hypothetical protein SLE2022_144420 [Rubroshorea leprosula]